MKKILLISLLTAFIVVPPIWAVDFNGDGTGDVAVFRGATGLWAVRNLSRFYFGGAGDYPVPLNYNSSSASVAAIFRPSSGLWAVRGGPRIYYGGSQDQPVTGDFNGDGLDEIGIFRPSSGLWAIRNRTRIYFGSSGDAPVPGDYDGDGTAEAGIFRSNSGLWALRGISRVYFGGSSDLPVPADYNSDGLDEIGIFRGGSGLWAIRGVTRSYFGGSGDVPQPFNITGDGSDKISVFRPNSGLWAIKGVSRLYYGGLVDFPIAADRYWSIPEFPLFGIEVASRHFDTAHLEKINQAGGRITRLNYISWAKLEKNNTTPDRYSWEIYDEDMAEFASEGLTPIITISDIPSWAGETRSGPFNDDARDDFAEFVGAVVNRYSRPPYNIKYWELFNEPDGTQPLWGAGITTWGYFGKEYALMLKEAYPAIKASDPSAQLVMGGLAYDGFTKDGGNFYKPFINNVLANGGGEYFDIMNFHYYYFARETWEGSIIGKVNALKVVMAQYGIDKPMICTEVGIWGYEEEYYLDLQARYVPMVYTRGFSAGLASVLWFPLASSAGGIFEGGLLREEDLSEKPAYLSYKVMISELGDYRYSAVIQTGSADLEGYEFISSSTGKSKYLIWAQEDTSGYISFPYERIRVVAIDGSVDFITDGGAGDLDNKNNGQIWIAITPSPVYVESW